ncbi:major facilitator superfamily domain-containing protein [Phlyctochytrium arcticum]|nr:major facilitator superfamily domain-containing protein [Phlyctochytrium arcticum]
MAPANPPSVHIDICPDSRDESLTVRRRSNAGPTLVDPNKSQATLASASTSGLLPLSSDDLRPQNVQQPTPIRTPLPKKQMAVVCLVTFVEPLQFGVLFPFVYFMVRDFHPEKSSHSLGGYVGLITSAFCIAQLFTALPWGWVSDKYGRKPVMIIGLAGNAIFMALFGISGSYTQAILFRTACGVLNGNVGVAKSVIGEITDDTNRSLAFSLWETAFGVGSIIGPAIGGLLTNPTEKLAFLFRNATVFKTHPYLLPCLACAFFSVCGALLAIFGFKETLGKGPSSSTEVKMTKGDTTKGPKSEILKSSHTLSGSGTDIGSNGELRRASLGSVNSNILPGVLSDDSDKQAAPPHANALSPPSYQSNEPRRGSVASITLNVARTARRGSMASILEHHHPISGSITSGPIDIVSAAYPGALAHRGSIMSLSSHSFPRQPRTFTVRSLITTRIMLPVLAYAVWALIQVIYDETLSIYAVAPLHASGLAISSQALGLVLTGAGVVQVLAQAFIYSPCERRFGLRWCFKIAAIAMTVFVVGTSFVGDLARKNNEGDALTERGRVAVIAVLALCLAGRTIAIAFGYITIMILINNSAPTPNTLGTVHGFGQVSCSAARAIGPAFAGLLWSESASSHLPFPLDFHLPFLLTGAISVGCIALGVWIERVEDRDEELKDVEVPMTLPIQMVGVETEGNRL